MPTPARTEAVIFDWAGTTVDFGSCAPIFVLAEAFQRVFGFRISVEEARRIAVR